MKLHQKNKYPPCLKELKFYLPFSELQKRGYEIKDIEQTYNIHMPAIRTKSLQIIQECCNGTFAAVVDKKKAYNTWTPEFLANWVFVKSLITDVIPKLSVPIMPSIYFDAGRLAAKNTDYFKRYMINELNKFGHYHEGCVICEISSVHEPCIWAADMVSGAFYHRHSNNDGTYASMINKNLIGNGCYYYWQNRATP